jgi:hypothetical protein
VRKILIVTIVIVLGLLTVWLLARKVVDDKDPVIEGERIGEAHSLALLGAHVAERVSKIQARSLHRAKPMIKIAAKTSPTSNAPTIETRVIGSRTEKGNLLISGESWAVDRKGEKLFGGKLEKIKALEVVLPPRPTRRSWAVGPAVSLDTSGFQVGVSILTPTAKILWWDPRALATITTDGRRTQAIASIVFEL